MLKDEIFKQKLKDAGDNKDKIIATYKWYLDQWIDRSERMECLLGDTERRFAMGDYLAEEGWVEPADEYEE